MSYFLGRLEHAVTSGRLVTTVAACTGLAAGRVGSAVSLARAYHSGVGVAPALAPRAGLLATSAAGWVGGRMAGGWLPGGLRVYSAPAPPLAPQGRRAASSTIAEPVQEPHSAPASGEFPTHIDPFALVQDDLDHLSRKMLTFVSNEVPMLSNAAEYFFRSGVQGKRLRATVMLLLSSSLSVVPPIPAPAAPHWHVDQLDKQKGVAEIAEMIHVASLLHDDVLDESSTRRGIGSVNAMMGNKLAILGGDFLLARASVRLAELGSTEAVWLVATMLDNLVKGEVMQATMPADSLLDFDQYMQKTFYKTGSLFAHSAQAVAVMGLHSPETCALAHAYGRHLGLAFQVVDDVLDFTARSGVLGKPAMNDLASGLATAPVLYAAEEFPALVPMIKRRFKHQGDIERASELVFQSQGIARAKELAAQHAAQAAQVIHAMPVPDTEHGRRCQQALIHITQLVLTRSK